ncbi:hypothetical protein [Pantoea sp. y20]
MTVNVMAGADWQEYDAGTDSVICCRFSEGELTQSDAQPAPTLIGFPVTEVLQYRVSGKVWLRAAKNSRKGALFVINRN